MKSGITLDEWKEQKLDGIEDEIDYEVDSKLLEEAWAEAHREESEVATAKQTIYNGGNKKAFIETMKQNIGQNETRSYEQ